MEARPTSIMDLPTEVHFEILSLLNLTAQILASGTCKLWKDILAGESFKNTRYHPAEFRNTKGYHLHKFLLAPVNLSCEIVAGKDTGNPVLQICQVSREVNADDPTKLWEFPPPAHLDITHCSFLSEPMAKTAQPLPTISFDGVTFRSGTAKYPNSVTEYDPTKTTLRKFLRRIAHSPFPLIGGLRGDQYNFENVLRYEMKLYELSKDWCSSSDDGAPKYRLVYPVDGKIGSSFDFWICPHVSTDRALRFEVRFRDY
ncbi:hypothetical protein TWF694_004704 [Orbilia ellipsospora]|uniref:F-box domain-containing protein n=1 Tax=Orbilia ellipsospora TaxID=2528407 RepID=A0AAV9WW95_9PEZI